jgi:hypothetical protein
MINWFFHLRDFRYKKYIDEKEHKDEDLENFIRLI